ncbi:hypothetical protein FKW77_003132 [Venturia effusa]|uniref:Uncharacterized protein n=1 Tax=Venturia effusa TaxID=50376 RepID=A0A517LAM6_9PEZI|nr:hypothetical protein FKW77_003132 [Venturia effusa]
MGGNCWRNHWGRLECRGRDDDESFFKSTGVWILIAFLIFGIVLAIAALLACAILRRRKSRRSRSRSSSRTVVNRPANNGDTWYRRGHDAGGGSSSRRNNDGYTGYRRGDVDHGPPPEGYYARGETAYPKAERARSRSLERRRSLGEK